jgi:hypothetical protein
VVGQPGRSHARYAAAHDAPTAALGFLASSFHMRMKGGARKEYTMQGSTRRSVRSHRKCGAPLRLYEPGTYSPDRKKKRVMK